LRYKDYDIQSLLAIIASEEDKKAFHELFRRYYSKSIEFAMLYVKDYSSAEDIVSETFIKLFIHRKELIKIENFNGYLFSSVKNHSLNFLQKNQRWLKFSFLDHPEDMYFTDFTNPEKEYLDLELKDVISHCVSQLPPKRRMVYQLIKDDGMKYKEVAELLGISANTVENHLDLAIKTLRKTLERYLKEKKYHPFK
jgi:RNA polymerase sigma-70 factor (family 1)